MLATILNESVVAGMVVLLHRCRTARLAPAAHLHISYAKDILAPVYDRDSAFPRRDAPELCQTMSLDSQRAQGMPGAQCTRSLACIEKSIRVSHHGHT